MRTWTRAASLAVCGHCVRFIDAGSPIQVIAIPGVKHGKIRCEACAEGEAPADLPALPERKAEPADMTRVGKLATDFKLAQLGERD